MDDDAGGAKSLMAKAKSLRRLTCKGIVASEVSTRSITLALIVHLTCTAYLFMPCKLSDHNVAWYGPKETTAPVSAADDTSQ